MKVYLHNTNTLIAQGDDLTIEVAVVGYMAEAAARLEHAAHGHKFNQNSVLDTEFDITSDGDVFITRKSGWDF